MVTVKELRIADVLPNSSLMNDTAGANIEDARGEIKVMLASSPRRSHFFEFGKLSGIAGSSCDSQPTISLSRSETGMTGGGNRSFLDLEVRLVAIRESFVLELALDFDRSRLSSLPPAGLGSPPLIETIVVC